jgi:hypothetical protein
MARSLRIQYAGAFYHVMARGKARAALFPGDTDRWLFLRSLGEAWVGRGQEGFAPR